MHWCPEACLAHVTTSFHRRLVVPRALKTHAHGSSYHHHCLLPCSAQHTHICRNMVAKVLVLRYTSTSHAHPPNPTQQLLSHFAATAPPVSEPSASLCVWLSSKAWQLMGPRGCCRSGSVCCSTRPQWLNLEACWCSQSASLVVLAPRGKMSHSAPTAGELLAARVQEEAARHHTRRKRMLQRGTQATTMQLTQATEPSYRLRGQQKGFVSLHNHGVRYCRVCQGGGKVGGHPHQRIGHVQ
jgi:hypothetical protein